MSNVGFVLRQQLKLTKSLERESDSEKLKEEMAHLASLVELVSDMIVVNERLQGELELCTLGELGYVAGTTVYSGRWSVDEDIHIILVPELKALGLRRDGEDFYSLTDVASLYRSHGTFYYSPPRAKAGIEESLIASLEELRDKL